jgi:REP element-mobilizing transposase RayT
MLPHYQKAARAAFITFCKVNRIAFNPEARDAILHHCLHDHSKRYDLRAAVVMPDHVHLLLTPLRDEKGWPYSLPTILKLIKGTSARTMNKLSNSDGPVWQEESFDQVLRSQESLEEKLEYIRQNPVRRGLRPDLKITTGFGSTQQQGSETARVGRTLLSDSADTISKPALAPPPKPDSQPAAPYLASGAAKNLHCPHPLPSGF